TLSIYGMSLAISVFITILMIYSGFQGIDPNKIKLAQTFGATKGQILTKVVLPGSVPTLVAALKVNAGLSLVGVIVGEFQSANVGLGYLIQYGSQIFKMNIVMTGITILAIVSSAMYLAISWLEAAGMRRGERGGRSDRHSKRQSFARSSSDRSPTQVLASSASAVPAAMAS